MARYRTPLAIPVCECRRQRRRLPSHRQAPHFQDYLKRTADMLQDKEAIAVVPSLLMNKGGLLYEAKERGWPVEWAGE